MNIGIVGGTGKEGRGMAARWCRAGHSVFLGSRDAERGRGAARELSSSQTGDGAASVRGGSNEDAVQEADVVVLSVPYAAHGATLRELKERLGSKVIIDITVPLKPPAVRRVQLPNGTAAALEARTILGPDAQLVAALHHVSSVHLSDLSHSIDCDVLACSDHAQALETALQLIGDLGAGRALDAGPLDNAVALESLTPVLLHLNKRYRSAGTGIRFTGLSSA